MCFYSITVNAKFCKIFHGDAAIFFLMLFQHFFSQKNAALEPETVDSNYLKLIEMP